jgi:predicted  nucleic acid-binding Zn-ribbon protein
MKRSVVLFLTCSIFLFSCSDLKKDEQLKRISKLEKEIRLIENERSINEIDTLTALRTATNAVEIRIKNYLVMDTINMVLGKKMDAYKIMRRSLKPLGKQNSQLKQAIREEEKSLKALKTDIENGAGSRDKYESYILFEKNKINQLQTLLDEYLKRKKETMDTYRQLHPELNQLSLELVRKYNLNH